MRSLLARLAALGTFAVLVSACSGGNATSLPFAGPPNNAGGSPGTVQTAANNLSVLRFIQGSPQFGAVDVCVDNLPFGVTSPQRTYGQTTALYEIPGGIAHTIAVYPGLAGAAAGNECSTAPGPYLGTSAIKFTTLTPATVNNRVTIVLGGTGATLGLYAFTEPSFAIAPAGNEVISHNAAPAFSTGKTVGFGICTTTAIPCATAVALAGATNLAKPTASTATATTANATSMAVSPLTTIPAGFYDGIGVAAGIPVPITSITAPGAVAGQPYVVQLYAYDGPAGGLNLIGLVEQTLGYGF
jgi:hypothetical protein